MAKEYLGNFERDIQTATDKLRDSDRISEKNKKLILRFIKEHKLRKNLSLPSIWKYLINMRLIAETLNKDLRKILNSKKDIYDLMDYLQNKEIGINGRKYSDNSIYDFKKTLKVFFKWLYNKGDRYPPCVE